MSTSKSESMDEATLAPSEEKLLLNIDTERTYYPGQQVTGAVFLPFTSFSHIKSVDVELAICSLTELHQSEDQEEPTSTSTQQLIHKETTNLWNSQSVEKKTMRRTSNGVSFEFAFTLPKSSVSPHAAGIQGSDDSDHNDGMPPSFHQSDVHHTAKVEYGILGTCTFVDVKTPLLQSHKELHVGCLPVSQLDLMRFVEMPANTSMILQKESSTNSGFLKRAFSKKSNEDLRYKFRIIIIRPENIRYNHRLYFKALLLTDFPPEFFKRQGEDPNKSVRRGENFNRYTLYLRSIQSNVVSFTNMQINEYDTSMYSDKTVISSYMSIPLDLTKLVPFEASKLPAPVARPTKYMLDFTNQLPPMTIPQLTPTFETDNIKMVHLLKFKFKVAQSQTANDIQVAECQQVINIVSPALDKAHLQSAKSSSGLGSVKVYEDSWVDSSTTLNPKLKDLSIKELSVTASQ